jgi:hypothetical protein
VYPSLYYIILYYIIFPANIIRTSKSRRKRWAGHVARMEGSCVKDIDGETRWKKTTCETDVDEIIILKSILKSGMRAELDLSDSG